MTPNWSSTLDFGGTSTSIYYTYLNGLRLSGRDISIYHNVHNKDMSFHTIRVQQQVAILDFILDQQQDYQ